jgi:hypothetical protein
VPLAEKDTELPDAKRHELAQSYANRAVNKLREAVEKGFRDASTIENDAQFAPLRQRQDFQDILSGLKQKQ